MARFPIDPDVRRAATLPAAFYRDPQTFAEVRERVFAPSWQFAFDTDAVRVPGAVYPFTLLEGYLDEPLVATRDTDDRLHLLSNVCTHRGMQVCEGAGNARFLRCRYHGRRFGLDGGFQHMPEFEETEGFPSAADDLPKVALETWGKLVFASILPDGPASRILEPMRTRLDWLPLEEFRFSPERSRDYMVRANWALYVDNYLEGFHIPFVHADLNAVLDYGAYATERFDRSNLQLAIAAGGEDAFELPASSPDHGSAIAAYYWWCFPNLMFNFYPWGLSINVVRPLAPDLTKVSFLCYPWREDLMDRGAGAALDRVEREDEAVVELVQRGVRSRRYTAGRFSPTREANVHHFHRLLSEALG